MKTSVLLLLSLILFTACQDQSPERYTQDAPEIDLYKSGFADYVSQNWEGLRSYYAEGAKIHFNSGNDNAITIEEAIEENKRTADLLSEYGFLADYSEYERVITDKDEMWVNFWGTWYGVIATTGKRVEIPVHLTARFVDSKVVAEYGYWDNLPFYLALNEAAAQAAEIDETAEETEE
jgi:hypothetical protein